MLGIVSAKCEDGKWVDNKVTCDANIYSGYASKRPEWKWGEAYKKDKCYYRDLNHDGSKVGCSVCCDD